MKNIFNGELARGKYFLILIFQVALGLGVAIAGAELDLQNKTSALQSISLTIILWMLIFFTMGITLLRRASDIHSKKNPVVVNIIIAAAIAISLKMVAAFSPKYFLVVMIIVGFIPKIKKNNEPVVQSE